MTRLWTAVRRKQAGHAAALSAVGGRFPGSDAKMTGPDVTTPRDDAEDARPPGKPGRDAPGSFTGHLVELRMRVILCLVGVLATMIVALVFYRQLSQVLMAPVEDYNLDVDEPLRLRILMVRPTDAFSVVLKMGFWGGLVLAFPIIIWHVWRFVSPGLHRRERRAVLPIFALGMFFFAGGCWFANEFVFPLALKYLLSFAPEMGADTTVSLAEYVHFFLMLHMAFGIAFETPLVVLALALVGLVTARGLVRRWRYVIVGTFVVGAVLTPPDAMTQLLMAGSLIVLYLLSIVLAWMFGRRTAEPESP